MSTISGLWVLCDEFGESVELNLAGERGTFSLFLPTSSLSANHSCLSLLSQSPDTIDYIAVATAGRRGSDFERKVAFGPALKLSKPLLVSDVLRLVPSQLQRHIKPPQRRVSGVPPASWKALLAALIDAGGMNREDLRPFEEILRTRRILSVRSLIDNITFERDATAVALEAFRGSSIRQRYLNATPTTSDAPFIRALEKSGARVLGTC